jgi:16S rRNA (cytosine967-C5)-methyltransferase
MTIPEKALRTQTTLVVETVAHVKQAVEAGHPADVTLSHLYRLHPEFGSRDRRLLSETVFAFFRWRGWLTPERAPDPTTACILAGLLDSDVMPPALAALTPQTTLPADLQSVGNLDLKARAAALATVTKTVRPVLTDLVPAWTFEHVAPVTRGVTPAAFRERLVTAWQTPPPTWLRIKPGTRDAALAALNAASLDAVAHTRLSDAIRVKRGANLWALPRATAHTIDIQDLSSQAVGAACAPQARQRWWDVCAGSGGKALHLAALMRSRGTILATDTRASILEQFKRRQQDAGVRMIELRRWDGLKEAAPEGPFDGILLDAPCSGLGTWHRNPDARWRLTESRVRELAGTQAALLRVCAPQLRPGGTLVYATCTLTRTENQDVIDAFLAEHPEFALDPFPNPLDGKPSKGCLTIHPWDGPCNGMFIARLTRTAAK